MSMKQANHICHKYCKHIWSTSKDLNNMRLVFFTWKLVEAILSLICVVIHVIGFSDRDEPLSHLMFYCGTFYGYFGLSILMCLSMCFGLSVPLIIDVIYAGAGVFGYAICSLMSMLEAEGDYHLMYLTDREEAEHKFFSMSRAQSMVSLFTTMWFMMHAFLVADMLCITELKSIETDPANQPLRVNCPCSKLATALDDVEVCTYFHLSAVKSRAIERYV